jgi:hypothetical protein
MREATDCLEAIILPGKDELWGWRRVSTQGTVIAESPIGFPSEGDALRAAQRHNQDLVTHEEPAGADTLG